MASKLKHGAIEPAIEDGVWYCYYHRQFNISNEKPCVSCKELVEFEDMKKRAREESAKLRGTHTYCKYCNVHIKNVFKTDGKTVSGHNSIWIEHKKTKTHIKNKRRWHENIGKSKL